MKLFAERGVTRISISDLAAATGMARGTIYSHVPEIDGLFEEVAAQLAQEMIDRVVAGFAGPAARRPTSGIEASTTRSAVCVERSNAIPGIRC